MRQHGHFIHNYFHFVRTIFETQSRKLAYYQLSDTAFWILIGTFEVQLVLRLTNSITEVIKFYILRYFFTFIFYVIFPKLLHKKNLGLIFTLANYLKIVMCLFLIFFYKELGNSSILFFYTMLRGMESGLYWPAHHMGRMKLVDESNRDNFGLKLQTIISVLPVFIPVITGVVITYASVEIIPFNPNLPEGYAWIFVLGLFAAVLMTFYSPRFESEFDFNISYRKVLSLIRNKKLRLFRYHDLLNGASTSSMMVALGFVNFFILKSEANLGLFYSIISLVAAIYMLHVRKNVLNNKSSRNSLFKIGLIGDVLSKLSIFLLPNFIGLILKGTFQTFFSPLKDIFGANISLKAFDKISSEEKISYGNFLIVQETYYFISRISIFILLLLLINIFTLDMVQISRFIFILFSITGFIEYYLIKKINEL